jgi:hypothetical protein
METRRGFFKTLAMNLTAAMAFAWGTPIKVVQAVKPLTDAELNELFVEALKAEVLGDHLILNESCWTAKQIGVAVYSYKDFDRIEHYVSPASHILTPEKTANFLT